MKFRSLLIDDEAIARKRLRSLLEPFSTTIEIVDEATDGLDALEKITTHKPDLVFLDIQMPGLNGFEVVQKLETQPLIIFTTAYDEFALRAFKENAIEYLLKPISSDELAHAIAKLESLAPKAGSPELEETIARLLASALPGAARPNRMQVKVGDSIKLVEYESIMYFEAEEKYTTIFTESAQYVIDDSLNDLEARLPADQFVRIHRKHIVNINWIAELKKWFDRRMLVVLKGSRKIELMVSRHYIDSIKNL